MMTTSLLEVVLVVVVTIVACAIWLGYRFGKWQSEIKGKYDEIERARTAALSKTEQELVGRSQRVTELETTIKRIDDSLTSVSTDAVQQVKAMAGVIQPVIAMFRTPQIAGIQYAEAELEVLLKSHLGDSLYERKPRFLASGNETVDFIIKLSDCVVPIDSKFPEAVYRMWVDEGDESQRKSRWRAFRDAMIKQLENTSKYIKPEAGTTDYALLFLPSDAIWQQAFLVGKWYGEENAILKKSQELRVFGCAAQTLMPYFGLLRLGLRNLKVSEDVKAVQRQIDQLKVSFKQFEGDWGTLKGHVQDAYNSISNTEKTKGGLSILQKSVEDLTSHEHESEKSPPAPSESAWSQETFSLKGGSEP